MPKNVKYGGGTNGLMGDFENFAHGRGAGLYGRGQGSNGGAHLVTLTLCTFIKFESAAKMREMIMVTKTLLDNVD